MALELTRRPGWPNTPWRSESHGGTVVWRTIWAPRATRLAFDASGGCWPRRSTYGSAYPQRWRSKNAEWWRRSARPASGC
jgi:hypothetical protein